jgi:hypothetical protein
MNLGKCLANVGVTLMVGLAVPLALGQATEPGMGSTAGAPAATSPTVPAERVAPGVPGIPPNTPRPLGPASGGSRGYGMKENYLAKKIADAQAQGKDVTTAKSQEAMGKAASRKGMNDEAARHFETALRSIGVIPIGLDQDAGEGNSETAADARRN